MTIPYYQLKKASELTKLEVYEIITLAATEEISLYTRVNGPPEYITYIDPNTNKINVYEHGNDPHGFLQISYADLQRVTPLCFRQFESGASNSLSIDIAPTLGLGDKYSITGRYTNLTLDIDNLFLIKEEISPYVGEDEPLQDDQVKRISLLKLIMVIIRGAYKYDPSQERNKVFGDIVLDVETSGIKLGEDTIRKILNECKNKVSIPK